MDAIHISRRQSLGGLGVAGLAGATFALGLGRPLAALAAVGAPDLSFDVFRKGDPFGDHRVAFARNGDQLQVDVAIDFRVKLAFLTVFEYSHRSRELWKDNRLVSLEGKTDDNGEKHSVSVRRSLSGLRVTSTAGNYDVPATTHPGSYWHPETTRQSAFINPQKGELVEVSFDAEGQEAVETLDGDQVVADRFYMHAPVPTTLWYTPDVRRWVGLACVIRGQEIDYRRTTPVIAG